MWSVDVHLWNITLFVTRIFGDTVGKPDRPKMIIGWCMICTHKRKCGCLKFEPACNERFAGPTLRFRLLPIHIFCLFQSELPRTKWRNFRPRSQCWSALVGIPTWLPCWAAALFGRRSACWWNTFHAAICCSTFAAFEWSSSAGPAFGPRALDT